MSVVIALAALGLLMLAAYRGYSVILFAPIAALLAVLLTEPAAVAPVRKLRRETFVLRVFIRFPPWVSDARRNIDCVVGPLP